MVQPSAELIEAESTREANFHSLLSELKYLQTRLEEEHEYELNHLESENQRLAALNNELVTHLKSQVCLDAPHIQNSSRPFVQRPHSRRPPQLMLETDTSTPNESIPQEYQMIACDSMRMPLQKDQSTPQSFDGDQDLVGHNYTMNRLSQESLFQVAASCQEGPYESELAGTTREKKVCVADVQLTDHEPSESKGKYRRSFWNVANSIHTRLASVRGPRDSETVEDELRKMRALYEDAEIEDVDPTTVPALPPNASWCEWCHHRALQVTSSNRFEILFAAAILINSVFLGVEVNHSVTYPFTENPPTFYAIGYCFTILFLVELLLRLTAYRLSFFYEGPCFWNYLDTFVVIASLVEVVADIVYFASSSSKQAVGVSNMRIFRIIRITRLIRIFRIARIVKLIRALRTLVYQILGTLRSVFWAMFLMLIIIYVFAMVFAQAASEYLAEHPDNELVMLYWGSLPRSIFTLYKSIIGGVDWENVVVPLSDIHGFWVALFTIFISFTFFAVLNVVTGVFCQSAIESAQLDHDMVIQQHMAHKKLYVMKIRRLFTDISPEEDCITYRTLEKHLHEDKVQAYFESLGLDITDAWGLFKLLDPDETHKVELEEFVESCLRLRGQAKALDVAKISYDNKRYRKKLFSWMRNTDRILASLARAHLEPSDGTLAMDGDKSRKRSTARTTDHDSNDYMMEICRMMSEKKPKMNGRLKH